MDNSVLLENLSEASGGPSVSKDRDKDRYVKILPYLLPILQVQCKGVFVCRLWHCC